MTPFECVPNFSEGRDGPKVERIAAAAGEVPGVSVLDVERNADHHRSVVTLYGDGPALLEGVFRAMRIATETIDLTHHRGEHPRMGATDVVPFVPLGDATIDEAVRLAERLGARVAEELVIPVYLYAEAARRAERRDLAVVRRGEFEGIRDSIATDPARAPDFGAPRVHPTAGAVAIGARPVLIAYNVLLATPDVGIAKRIAHLVRARDGGLPEVKALGFEIAERHRAQVSMNLTDYRTTPIPRAFEAVRAAAEGLGTSVEESEIVGLVPEDALFDAAEASLALKGFQRRAILERRVRAVDAAGPGHEPLRLFLGRLAARTPTPGGGSAAAVAGALACALGEMVIAYSSKGPVSAPELVGAAAALAGARVRFLVLCDDDARAYEAVRAAARARKERTEDAGAVTSYRDALRGAATVPLETARRAHELARRLAEIGPRTKPALASDLLTSQALFRAAIDGALANVRSNLEALESAGGDVGSLRAEAEALRI